MTKRQRYHVEFDPKLIKACVELVRAADKRGVTRNDVVEELNVDTVTAHELLALLFLKQKIQPRAMSAFTGTVRMPVYRWVPMKKGVQRLSPGSVRKKAARKKVQSAKSQGPKVDDQGLGGRMSSTGAKYQTDERGRISVGLKSPYDE